ncbi:APC family permease (plasmid) [Streptomyces clavuligerus]|uniref:APC family permease n=1 Tax=Streptomyces clavuligerus TaxID=1901 RepID=UPI0005D1B3BC|nr:APC family permease [Streptomyces clavuligerus]MBY6306625.1 APC family permease [Streptomyces clavuligerus]QCS10983.1 APC family permease [Streptomyces clavuligerus]QPJ98420.1 amino acid permease [Streptomyces clavuligerus]WDN57636.1 APC family permease [Streptomyces clavuligerus]
MLPGLSEEQVRALRRVGRAWGRVSVAPEVWRRALPVEPDVGAFPVSAEAGRAWFGRLVPLPPLRVRAAGPRAAAGVQAEAVSRVRRVLVGAPLASSAFVTERMRKLVALPVLSADALSSVAYGPEAMLTVLVLAGAAGLAYSFPVSAVIVFLMVAVGVSYRQTIRAYPHGGGSYIVAGDNLGPVAGLVAAAGLMTDYVLTVAVSIASGIAAITSALPGLTPWTVPLGVLVIVVLLAGNLRGIRQAGALFAAPTYAFIVAMFALVAAGLVDAARSGFQPVPPPSLPVTETVGLLLIARAFSSGATAMTGIEAISNAVPAFRPVEWRNARTTLSWMVGLLIAMFAGIVVLIHLTGVVPRSQETVLSQLAHLSFGQGWMYVYVQAATAAVLLLAANTAYNDFPRVLSLLARDDYAPKTFLRLGDRLAYSGGILLLSLAAVLVYVAFEGQTNSLIPLYAVGVFLAFTLSQTGMVVHWWRRRDPHWRKSLLFNATGALLSALVLLTAGISKFTSGAWVALIAIALFLLVTTRIKRHYATAREALRLRPHAVELPAPTSTGPLAPATRAAAADADRETEEIPEEIHHLSVIAVATLDLAAMRTLAYAASLGQPALAVHISTTEDEERRFRAYWGLWGDHLPLQTVLSPYRAVVAPLVHYIETLHRLNPGLTLTVFLPEIVTRHRWHRLLHSRTASRLRHALRNLPKIVITTVPFHLPR